jgi:hypothetical protein
MQLRHIVSKFPFCNDNITHWALLWVFVDQNEHPASPQWAAMRRHDSESFQKDSSRTMTKFIWQSGVQDPSISTRWFLQELWGRETRREGCNAVCASALRFSSALQLNAILIRSSTILRQVTDCSRIFFVVYSIWGCCHWEGTSHVQVCERRHKALMWFIEWAS